MRRSAAVLRMFHAKALDFPYLKAARLKNALAWIEYLISNAGPNQ
jgi:hypothetical protein